MMHAKETPPSPRSVRADLPEPIERIVLKCLAKEPAHRFANAKEVADALRAWQAGSPLAFTLRIPGATAEQPAVAAAAPPKKRMTAARRFAAIAGPALAMCMAVAVLMPALRRGRSSAPPPMPDGAMFGSDSKEMARNDVPAEPAPPPKAVAAPGSGTYDGDRASAERDDDKKTRAGGGGGATGGEVLADSSSVDATTMARLTLRTGGVRAEVWIDGARVAPAARFNRREVPSGPHRMRFRRLGEGFEVPVDLPASDVCLFVDFDAKRVVPCP